MATDITREDVETTITVLSTNGLRKQVDSWVGNGPNEPITADEFTAAVGEDNVAKSAAAAGRTPQAFATEAAEALPRFIDEVTPGGSVAGGIETPMGHEGFGILTQAMGSIRQAARTVVGEAGEIARGLGAGVNVVGQHWQTATNRPLPGTDDPSV
ncbi:YidB family protein [Kitasatospora sp. NPDC094015]|uniref:YidB family protein n=1 Tax=Kitasatospora sp. NPDC094015 TaxID=3155205 RepID=UPI003319D78C